MIGSDANGKISWTVIIGETGLVVASGAAWLYLAGWRFAEQYFAEFGIGISAIGLDREYLITYGVWVVLDHWGLLAVGAAALVGGFRLWQTRGRRALGPVPAVAIVGVVAALIVALFALAHELGGRDARHRVAQIRAHDYAGLRNVRLHTAAAWAEGSDALKALAQDLADPQACYRLLFADRTSVFVIKPVRGEPDWPVPVLQVARADIKAVRILDRERSCSSAP